MNYTLQKNCNLKHYTTILVGGNVTDALFPHNKNGIQECFEYLASIKKPFFILSGGANSIIQDQDLDSACILTHRLNSFQVDGDNVIAQSGVPMMYLAEQLLKVYRLKGFEWAYGLPGFIGGGIFMNARVYEKEFSDIVNWVEVFDYENRDFKKISLQECEYGYKKSIFQKKPYFIYQTSLNLKPMTQNDSSLLEKSILLKKDRVTKGQHDYPSAGSLFKNNYHQGISVGELLDGLDLKGFTHPEYPDIKISEKHANFFVNTTGQGSYKNLIGFIKYIQKYVYEKKGITLEPEVQFLPNNTRDSF